MKTKILHTFTIAAVLLASTLAIPQRLLGEALPLLHPLFATNAVLQRDARVTVWGWSTPGVKVIVSFAGQRHAAVTRTDGTWRVHLRPMAASAEARTLQVTSSDGGSERAEDVLVGDVWLCSGQSNMEMGMVACEADEDIAAADFPKIRLLTVPHRVVREPLKVVDTEWKVCSPEALKQGVYGGFSATAFYFGRMLQKELQVPIGLIHSSWGGTIAEAWMSYETIEKIESMRERLEEFSSASAQPQDPSKFRSVYEAWAQKADPGTAQGWNRETLSGGNWKRVALPQHFEKAGLEGFDGTVWFRREFTVPAEWAGKPATLSLGPVDDTDTTWVNGKWVGQMNRHDQPRVYQLGPEILKAGRNVIAVRVLDTGGGGGLYGNAEDLKVSLAGSSTTAVSLAGEWEMSESSRLNQLGAPPQTPDPNNPNVTTVLYNGMIAPLTPYTIKGAIWYQGESNAGRAEQYRELLPALIGDWRTRFESGKFPFYIVQLAAFMPVHPEPRENEWAELREAQAMAAQKTPNSGLAVAIDIGEADDIHPKNKRDVGQRLALVALAKDYGKKIEYSGPWYRKMQVEKGAIRIHFEHVDSGLVTKGGPPKGFAIAGEDRKFVWADAVIDGKTVRVASPAVPRPVAVRYAWDINPVCNLYNGAGLPAVPFRTDEWPGVTTGKK